MKTRDRIEESAGIVGLAATRAYWLLGNHLTVLADRADTNGHYDLIEGRQPAGNQTPPHRHTRYAELLYVLDGELTVWAGERNEVLHAGDTFSIPVGTPHVVAVTGADPAHALVVASPSGFAQLIEQAGIPETGGPPPQSTSADLERFNRAAAEAGDEILGPPGVLPTL
jgi:mannose-6-phosphate isomerase-like protein (cupin superfamily)